MKNNLPFINNIQLYNQFVYLRYNILLMIDSPFLRYTSIYILVKIIHYNQIDSMIVKLNFCDAIQVHQLFKFNPSHVRYSIQNACFGWFFICKLQFHIGCQDFINWFVWAYDTCFSMLYSLINKQLGLGNRYNHCYYLLLEIQTFFLPVIVCIYSYNLSTRISYI